MKLSCIALGALSALAPALSPPAPAQDAEPAPSDDRLREAWSFLLPEEQFEVCEWYRAEVSYLDTYQNKMIAYVLGGEERDRGTWPAPEPTPYFDPEVHCPAQPIPRQRLDPNSNAAKRAVKLFGQGNAADPLRRSWAYDWASGEIVMLAEETDPTVLFENAMRGLPPLIDLAEALVLRRLDDGEERVALAAYAHAYTDRSGNVFPGVTLYDAWSSGREFEMPDVDTLGILHTVYNDWRSYKAPVPANKQKPLYDKIGEAFLTAKRHRGLREALAANYLRGNALPNDIYKSSALAFNALWEEATGVPEELAKELPKAKDWKKYMERLVKQQKKKKFVEAGQNRLAWLESERVRVKATLVRVMTEFGALDRTELPKPKPTGKESD